MRLARSRAGAGAAALCMSLVAALLATLGPCPASATSEWHRQQVGAVTRAHFDGRHVLVATQPGVLASLDSRTGGVGASAVQCCLFPPKRLRRALTDALTHWRRTVQSGELTCPAKKRPQAWRSAPPPRVLLLPGWSPPSPGAASCRRGQRRYVRAHARGGSPL
jgi:hypothetical protein